MRDKEIRSEIDSQNVKGLIIINGGGVIALMTLLPKIITNPNFEYFAGTVLLGILLLVLGLTSTLLHNHFRRRCSLAYESEEPKRKCLFFGAEPRVCHYSHLFMWGGYLFFVVASIVVVIGGFQSLMN